MWLSRRASALLQASSTVTPTLSARATFARGFSAVSEVDKRSRSLRAQLAHVL